MSREEGGGGRLDGVGEGGSVSKVIVVIVVGSVVCFLLSGKLERN